jgi:hypothetical protein
MLMDITSYKRHMQTAKAASIYRVVRVILRSPVI